MLTHQVTRGDTLWRLANIYLGNGARWPEIFRTHNMVAEKPNPHTPLMPITNENLIFVGQTIVLPFRQKRPQKGDGKRAEGEKLSQLFDLKVNYTIGRDTPPIKYIWPLADLTVTTELSGDIGLEITSDRQRNHGIELAMSKNPIQIKQKLNAAYDPAICALTARPAMTYESGRVKINAPIGAAANAGPFTINVQVNTPNHMAGSVSPPTLGGAFNVKGITYKFTADITLSAEVTWVPKPGSKQTEPVRIVEQVKEREPVKDGGLSIDWNEIRAKITWTIFGATLMMLGYRQLPIQKGATSITPFMHIIDPGNPRNRVYYNSDA